MLTACAAKIGYATKTTLQMKKGVPRHALANEFCFAPKRLAERIRSADSLSAPAAAAPQTPRQDAAADTPADARAHADTPWYSREWPPGQDGRPQTPPRAAAAATDYR